MLHGKNIRLRTVERSDIHWLLLWENDPENWLVSGTSESFTKEEIEAFIEEQLKGETPEQVRWMICLQHENRPVGTLDLFEINHSERNAGVGVLIANASDRKCGYASEALTLMIHQLTEEGKLDYLFCTIQSTNRASIALFEKLGFEKTAIRKDWYLHNGKFMDEYRYQLWLKK